MFVLAQVQEKLDYRNCKSRHFKETTSLGRIAQTATLLGLIFGVHMTLFCIAIYQAWSVIWIQWCSYVALLSVFHLLEFFATALNRDDELSNNSFVVNHSLAYTAAALASWIEFWTETWLDHYGLLPFNKESFWQVGFVIMVVGNAIRFHGMTYCGKNFSHLVMTERREGHQLVTTGIYALLRHPAYFGWFYWSVGTQILLGNPLCTIAYALASWRFFANRIPFEESHLEEFYGEEYKAYKGRTFVGIPFV
jgi:protein-S-isoprenylcysteine O-methyltransferase